MSDPEDPRALLPIKHVNRPHHPVCIPIGTGKIPYQDQTRHFVILKYTGAKVPKYAVVLSRLVITEPIFFGLGGVETLFSVPSLDMALWYLGQLRKIDKTYSVIDRLSRIYG